MDDAFLVGRRQALRHLDGQLRGLAGRERSLFQPGAQGFAFEQLHHDIGRVALRREVVDAKNVRMIQRRHGLGFALESGQGLGVFRQMFRQHFHGDKAVEPRVLGLPHLAHAPRAQGRKDLVRAEANARGEGH